MYITMNGSTPYWRESGQNFEYKQPWEWRSQNHVCRRIISDDSWDQEFPDLHSYLWNGPGFWYQGIEYKDLVLFYDDEDMLVL